MYVTEMYVINESGNFVTTVSFLNLTYRKFTRGIFLKIEGHT